MSGLLAWLPSLQSPVLWTSTLLAREAQAAATLAAKTNAAKTFLFSQSSPIIFTQSQLQSLATACQGTGVDIPALITSKPHTATAKTQGKVLLKALSSHVQAYIEFLQRYAASAPELTQVINGLIVFKGKLQDLSTDFQSLNTDTSNAATISSATVASSTTQVTKRASQVKREINHYLTAAVGGSALSASSATMARELMKQGYDIVAAIADDSRALMNDITVTVSSQTQTNANTNTVMPQPISTPAGPPPQTLTQPATGAAACLPITMQSPLVWASSIAKKIEQEQKVIDAEIEKALQTIKQGGGLAQFAANDLSGIKTVCKRYAVDAEKLITSAETKLGPDLTEGAALLSGLNSDIGIFINFLTIIKPLAPAQDSAQIGLVITDLELVQKVLQASSAGLTIAGSLLNDAGGLSTAVSSGNEGVTEQRASQVKTDIENALKVAVAAKVLPAQNADDAKNIIENGFTLATEAADVLGKILAPINVKVANSKQAQAVAPAAAQSPSRLGLF